MRFHLLILGSILSISSLAAQTKIACIGDSITEGAGLNSPSTESYPARLQRLLGTNDFLVRNFGVSGRTLLKRGDYPYWNETAFAASRTFGPDIVIIQLGTNDSKPQNWAYGSNFIPDYKALIAVYAALPTAPRIYLCTPCPVYANGAFGINPGIIRTNIAPSIRELAAELSLPLIDLHLRMVDSSWFPDTVHPNTRGMAAMASVMFESLFGLPSLDSAPSMTLERLSPTRIVLSWPANAAALVPQISTSLAAHNWALLTAVPYKTDQTIRQTNTFTIVPQRYFRLARP